jgi:GNAT superfamily N-acetyltransferase
MDVRARTVEDLDALVRLARRVHRHDGYPPRRPGDLRAFVAGDDAVAAWVAVVSGRIVGHVALHRTSSPEVMALARSATGCAAGELAVVARLLTDPAARRQGVGAALLAVATQGSVARGRRPILDVATHFDAAIALYERAGWERVGTVTVAVPGDEPLDEHVYLGPAGVLVGWGSPSPHERSRAPRCRPPRLTRS